MPHPAGPGMGSVREMDPTATTRTSYGIRRFSPARGSKSTPRAPVSILVTQPLSMRQRRSTRRSGTTTWRGSRLPAAASGRNGC